MQPHFFVDVHCHPSIKAYARSFAQTPGQQSEDINNHTSVWRHDAPSLFDKIKNYIASLTNFIQSDGTSLARGKVGVACLSFYPQEKGFFINKLGTGIVSDALTKLATEFGQQRIDFIQQMTSYWSDLQNEMAFVKQGEGKTVTIDGKPFTYQIATSYADIALAMRDETLGVSKIIFVPTIEGCHVFDQVMNCYVPSGTFPDGVPADALQQTLQRIRDLRGSKNGMLRPVFITLTHHFWNGLAGQARSLGGLVKCVIDQENGLTEGLKESGKQVIRALLQNATGDDGNPLPKIYLDIKHMSRQTRLDYFAMLDEEFSDVLVPLIASHAGVTGLSAPGGTTQTPAAQEGLFMTDDINFFDDEIMRIELSGGIVGIQLDERRIGSKQALRNARGNIRRRDILFAWSKLVWNQVRHMAELLDMNGRYAWNIQTLGSDFDGIIDPINGYWTSETFDDLDDYLLKHAFDYIKGVKAPCPLLQDRNKAVSAEEIVERVMTSNALDLLSRIF